jgi:hypothetical protein
MLNKIILLLNLVLVLWSPPAYGNDGKFTLVPRGGRVSFQATCFDDVATAKLLAWKEFQKIEFDNRLKFELDLQREKLSLELKTVQIKFDEATIRYEEKIRLRDEEIKDLRDLIKKDRKVNLPLVIAGSVAAGIAIGVGSAYAIDRAFQ